MPYDTWLNVLTGISQGSFDKLYVKDANGDMVDVLTIGGSGGSYTHPSHHPISMITGLQPALDSKVDDSQVLTNVPANALFTDTLYTHPSQHSISMITGLQPALDAKVDDSQVLTNVPANALFTDTLYTHPTQHSIAMITGLQGELDSKVDDTQVLTDVPSGAIFTDTVYSAGSNISIVNNVISASTGGSSLVLQKDGVTQAATTLNFLGNSGVLSGSTLSIGRLTSYDKLPLVNGSTIKDLLQDANGNLVWSNDILTTNPYLVNVLQAYPTTAVMNNTLSSYALTSAMNTALAAKQNTLTAGAGAFLSGSTISGYGLRWLTNSSPSTTIQDLHFTSGFQVAETFSLSTGRTSLDITAAPDLSAYSTTAQTATLLAGKQVNLSATQTSTETVFDRDVILTQTGNNPSLKWRVPGYPDMRFLLQSNGNSGLNCSGQYFSITTGGASYHMPILCNNADVTVAGTLSASVKNFTIRDPRPAVTSSAENMIPKLRHWCVEGDTPAGMLMYRRQVTATIAGNYTIQMPDWFEYLAEDVQCFSSPAGRHFGMSWAEQDADDPNVIRVGCSKAGLYNILITACRIDHCALYMCAREVLFEEDRTSAA